MGGSKGGSSSAAMNSSGPTRLAGIQLQSSCLGNPLPLVFGTFRAPCNLIWQSDFTWVPITQVVASGGGGGKGGGKGGGGSTTITTGYNYYANLMLGICEGPVEGFLRVWQSSTVGYASQGAFGISYSTGPIATTGTVAQPTAHPESALTYSGMAYCYNASMFLGTSGAPPNTNVEVIGFCATQWDRYTGNPSAKDCLPSDIIRFIVSNPYAGAGWASSKIDPTNTLNGDPYQSYDNYCKANEFYISMAITSPTTAANIIQEILDATNSDVVWGVGESGGFALKIIPYGDTAVGGRDASYEPNVTPLYDFTANDYIGVIDERGQATGNSPISVEMTSPQEIFNVVPIEFSDRALEYATSTIEGVEPVDVSINGRKKDGSKSLHCITKSTHAASIGSIKAMRNVHVRRTFNFALPYRYMLLEPMDLNTLTEPIRGYDKEPCRLVSITYPGDGDSGSGFACVAEEWPMGIATAAEYTVQNAEGKPSPRQSNMDPGDALPPLVAPMSRLASDVPNEYIIAAAGASDAWGGAEVWVSTDNQTYKYYGVIQRPCTFGDVYSSGSVQPVDHFSISPVVNIPSPSNCPWTQDIKNSLIIQCAAPVMELEDQASQDAINLNLPIMLCQGNLEHQQNLGYSTTSLSCDEVLAYEQVDLLDAGYTLSVAPTGGTAPDGYVELNVTISPTPAMNWNFAWSGSPQILSIAANEGSFIIHAPKQGLLEDDYVVGQISCTMTLGAN